MDSITHAFFILIFFPSLFHAYLPFAVLGALIPDTDFFYKVVSDRFPSLYIFTHGGFTHSITGAIAASFLAWSVVMVFIFYGITGILPLPYNTGIIYLFITAGALSHLFLDLLTFPGIPLWYPFSDRKCTLGIFPGPSLVLFASSILISILLLTGTSVDAVLWAYAVFFISIILARTGLKIYMSQKTSGIALPTFNPLKWLFIAENNERYIVKSYDIRHGIFETRIFEKFQEISPREAARFAELPEFRRQKFYSYILIAGRNGDKVSFHDPLREEGMIFYPPYYIRLTLDARP